MIQKHAFHNRLIILGFGSIGRAVLPLIFQQLAINPSQITIIANDASGKSIAQAYGILFELKYITQSNYSQTIGEKLAQGNFLLNLSVNISSFDLIELCRQFGALYLDTAIESWPKGYLDCELPPSFRTNYHLRESLLTLKSDKKNPTAIITHGANPGLVSHFLKQALMNLAYDNEMVINTPNTAMEWASLANALAIKTIHVAERDSQITLCPKKISESVNSWSVDGFLGEASQPAELGWGTHERHWPNDASHHDQGSQCAIFLNQPGGSTRVRTWTPSHGAFHGYLITHAESIAIADYLTLKKESHVAYRPTVHYAYEPCPDAVRSLAEFKSTEWYQQGQNRLIVDDIVDGADELGVLLMGNKKGAYWFGSYLSIHDARTIAPYNNATSLQVASGVIAAMVWAIEHPDQGLLEAEDIDFQYILNIAQPYLGQVAGYYTEWTPLQNRALLFPEPLDLNDPWQFLNIRVD